MRGARLEEVTGVGEGRLRLKGVLVGERTLSVPTGESGGVGGKAGRLVGRNMDWFFSV